MDVVELLGIPHGREEVRWEGSEGEKTFIKKRREYGNMKYDEILKIIESDGGGEKFEFLFMLHMLGTFLAPTGSNKVSDKLLKVVCCTMKGVANFDWATFICNDLKKELEDYLRSCRTEKSGTHNVGGCLYLLLLILGERFPLSEPVQHHSEHPIKFWTGERIREMIGKERNSNIGILYSKKKGGEVRGPGSSVLPSLDPVLKELHGRLMSIIDESHRSLVSVVEEELLKAQVILEQQRRQGGYQDAGPSGSKAYVDEEKSKSRSEEEDEGDDERAVDMVHIGDDEKKEEEAEIFVTYSESEKEDETGHDVKEIRRVSKRLRKPKKMSHWVLTKPMKRKNQKDDKELFFDAISRLTKHKEDGDVILIDIEDEEINRDQLCSLGGINRLSNRIVSLVCKTLMIDQKKEGHVSRHIFCADFMLLLTNKPRGWKIDEWKDQLLPRYVGYNIAKCDLIMTPVLVSEHWFCIALEPKTMNFYVLDSMKPIDQFHKKGKQKKGSSIENAQITAITYLRDRFDEILHVVEPKEVGKKGDIIWAPVPQQNNLRDCGVHVLVWLQNWKPGVTLHINDDDIKEYQKNFMWWLVNHELNKKKEDALGLILTEIGDKKRKH